MYFAHTECHSCVTSGYLYYATGAATNVFRTAAGEKGANRDLLKTITKPFTKIVIQLDKKVLEAMATGDEKLASQSLIKVCDCSLKLNMLGSELFP